MITPDPRSSIPAKTQHHNRLIPPLRSPLMPYIPESRPGSTSGWYEASLLSDIQREDRSGAQDPLTQDESVVTSHARGSRERVRNISKIRREERSRPQSLRDHRINSVVSLDLSAHPLPPASRNDAAEEPIDSKTHIEDSLAQGAEVSVEVPGEQKAVADGSACGPIIDLPSTAPLVLKAGKNAPLNRLQIVEIFNPAAAPPIGTQDPENRIAGQMSFKLKPLERVAETFFLLLPVLTAGYLLASCCVPTTWWRERLSIASITFSWKEEATEVPPSLLIGAFGWCIHEATQGT